MTRSLAVAIGVMLCAVPSLAWARPKVAVVEFEGDVGGEVTDMVTEALDGDLTVVGRREVNRTVDKLGFEPSDLGAKELKKLARELDADAIVQGKLSMKGENHLLHVKLFVHGKKARGFKVEFGSAKSPKFKQKLHDKMVEKLGEDAPKDDEPKKDVKKTGDDEEDPLNNKLPRTVKKDPKDAKGPDDDHPRKKSKRSARRGGDDEEIDVEATAENDDTRPHATRHTANRVGFRIDVGGSATERSLKFNARAADPTFNPPKDYKNAAVGGFRVAAELYPLAFDDPGSIASGIGLAGELDQTIVLNVTSNAQMGTKFPVTSRRFSFGPRFRIAFGKHATSPTVTLGVGYGHRTFQINRAALMPGNVIDLPDVDYVGFNPGIEFRLPILEQVALLFGGRALLLTGAGAIQTQAEYGQAKITGGEGMGGLDIVIMNRVALRVTVEAAQLGFAFLGNGQQSNNRDNMPATNDVGGAADRYVGGAATLAVMY